MIMEINKITNRMRIIGTVFFISSFLIGWLYEGKAWLYVFYPACALIFTRMVYELVHFKEYKVTNINMIVTFPIILFVVFILVHYNII